MGASILNFDQRDIVKTRRNCFFPCISSTSMWQQQHIYLCSTLTPPHLCPPPASLTHNKLVHKGTAAVVLWTESYCSWNGQMCFEYQGLFPPSLIVLLYPFLADQYITLSLNIRIFQTHFSVFYFNFSLNGFNMMSRKKLIAANYLRLCLVHVDFLVWKSATKILCDSDVAQCPPFEGKKNKFWKVPFHTRF